MIIVLLRGINVGGHKKLPMADLRRWLTDAGFEGVRTYIQSGNVLVPGDHDPTTVGSTVAKVIAEQAGFEVPVAALTVAQLHELERTNPFRDGEDKQVHLGVPTGPEHREKLAGLSATDHGSESLVVRAEAVWMHTPDGMARSKLAPKVSRKAGDVLTFRNRRTLSKLLAMAT